MANLSDKLTALADEARSRTSSTAKMSLDDMINAFKNQTTYVIPKGTLVFNGDSISENVTFASDWYSISGTNFDSASGLNLAKNGSGYNLFLHLVFTNVTTYGDSWIKWDGVNDHVTFGPIVGEDIIRIPFSDYQNGWKLMIHGFGTNATIRRSACYIDAQPAPSLMGGVIKPVLSTMLGGVAA